MLSSDICADESTLCMALLQLQKDKQVIVSLHEGEKVIQLNKAHYFVWKLSCAYKCFFFHWCSSKIVKFCQAGQERVSPLNDVDIGIYQLQRSEKLLGERVEKLGREADRSDFR